MAEEADKPIRVLVVDDDASIVAMLTRYLGKQGFEVTTASDPVQGLEKVAAADFDMVITDLMMPHMDGREFVRRLRLEPKSRDLPVIIMTAYPSDEGADQSLRDGAAFFLPKPLDLDALATLIRFAR